MELGIDTITRRKKLAKISEVVEYVEIRLESCLSVESSVSPLLGTLEEETQLEEEVTPSKLSGETSLDTDAIRKYIPIEIDREISMDTPVTMAQEGGGMDPLPIPSMPSIDSLVRLRGLPILVPQNLAAVDMPSHLPKFMELKMRILLGTWRGTLRGWLILLSPIRDIGWFWFPTTLKGEA